MASSAHNSNATSIATTLLPSTNHPKNPLALASQFNYAKSVRYLFLPCCVSLSPTHETNLSTCIPFLLTVFTQLILSMLM